MPRLEIALLGPPKIKIGGNPVQSDRRKAIALLAYLA
jgi:DNA-binding SARP family transcriptional activator